MKKVYMLALAMFGFVVANAQSEVQVRANKEQQPVYSKKAKPALQQQDKVIIWENDFSDPSDWELTTSDDCPTVVWQIGVGLEATGGFPTPPVESTTADNGYAMIDSDTYNGPCGFGEDARMTTAEPIDLSAYSHVVVEFETNFRSFNDDEGFLVVSTDGTWPDLEFGANDDQTYDNVYRIYGPNEDPSDNPTIISINVSNSAGSQPNVQFRINYVGQWGYTWFIDDFKVIEQPQNDVRLEYTVVSTKAEDGFEFGNVPTSQLPDMLDLQGQVLNFGYDDQTNVALNAQFSLEGTVVIDETMTEPSITAATAQAFDMETDPSSLATGIYSGTFTLTSDQEQDGENFGNNTIDRQFGITDGMYSMDGVDVYTNPVLGQRGPGSFYFNNNPDDGAYQGGAVMTYYNIANETYATGVNVKLGANTVAQATITAWMADTADILNDVFDDYYAESEAYVITEDDIAAGEVTLNFIDPFQAPIGGYYVGLNIEEDQYGEQFRVIDDVTVPQPGAASMMILDGSLSGSGDCLAIRMLTAIDVSVSELSSLDFELSQNTPNPASANTLISYNLTSPNTVNLVITDVTGKEIMTINEGNKSAGNYTMNVDVSELAAGVYTYTLNVGANQISKRMIIQ